MPKIIIADPDYSARSALALLLTHKLNPVEIQQVEDIEGLIQKLADASPDVLLLDWKLYGAPAIETCTLLQKAFPHLKIILLSINPSDVFNAHSVGAEFIYKGATPDEVVDILVSCLQNNQKIETTE